MRIKVNGKDTEVADEITVEGLLSRLEAPAASVAVERNGKIVPRAKYGATALAPEDEVEVVTFVGGG
ncbi:MAG: sulfur carrier protein ThiS [Planctomycetota bacterium]